MAKDTHCSDKCCGADVKAEDCTCPPTCKHCNCNAVAEVTERDVDDNFNINPKHKAIAALGRKMIDMSSNTTGTDDNSLMIANALSRLGEALESFGATFGPKSMADVEKMTGMNQDIIQMLISKAKADKNASTNRAAEPAESLRPAGAKELKKHANNLNKHIPDNKRSEEFVKKMAIKYAQSNPGIDANDLFDTYVAMFNVHQPQSPFLENTNEGLADMADMAERDHEVQMARAELYKIGKYAIKLHELLKGVSEAEGIDGWMQSKITKAADYIGSVYHTLDYDIATESKKTFKSTMSEADAVDYKNALSERMNKISKK